jgi:hypothetical protein
LLIVNSLNFIILVMLHSFEAWHGVCLPDPFWCGLENFSDSDSLIPEV